MRLTVFRIDYNPDYLFELHKAVLDKMKVKRSRVRKWLYGLVLKETTSMGNLSEMSSQFNLII